MNKLDRFSMDHHKVDPPRLHGDLNRLVDQVNGNFADHATQIATANQTIATQASTIADLATRLKALEDANP